MVLCQNLHLTLRLLPLVLHLLPLSSFFTRLILLHWLVVFIDLSVCVVMAFLWGRLLVHIGPKYGWLLHLLGADVHTHTEVGA